MKQVKLNDRQGEKDENNSCEINSEQKEFNKEESKPETDYRG